VNCLQFNLAVLVCNFVEIRRCLPELWQRIQGYSFSWTECILNVLQSGTNADHVYVRSVDEVDGTFKYTPYQKLRRPRARVRNKRGQEHEGPMQLRVWNSLPNLTKTIWQFRKV